MVLLSFLAIGQSVIGSTQIAAQERRGPRILLNTLPQVGTEWDGPGRMKWLQTAANIFDLIYKGEGGIEIKSAIATRSPRPPQD